jgi:ribonuclease G
VSYELIIDYDQHGEKIALLNNKKLVELHQEGVENQFSVGDIYWAKIKKIMPGLNAAFVDVGYKKDAFLHYHDLGPNIRSLLKISKQIRQGSRTDGDLNGFELEPETLKTGKMTDLFKRGQELMVQVVKEPISTKGPRLSTEISIAGKYFILVPFINAVSLSKKIDGKEERMRLKNLARSLKPENVGLITRTAAEGKSAEELHKDILGLIDQWKTTCENLPQAKPRQRLLGSMSRSQAIIKDLLSLNFANIMVSDKALYTELRSFAKNETPELYPVIKHYRGNERIFTKFGIDKQIKASFGKSVTCPKGSYLIIEHTEAMHVIDVNSGGKQNRKSSQEENALATNLDAAEEIARQLRLRDMGGIIVIDFIDLRSPSHKRQLSEALRKHMSEDRAKHTILPISKFGLIQITRQRVRPEMNIQTSEKCPMCKGSGNIESSVLIDEEIENKVLDVRSRLNLKKLKLVCHPYIAAYLTKGLPSIRQRWLIKNGINVSIKPDNSYHYGEYHMFQMNDEEIDFN